MKNLLLILALACVTLSSCSDFLDEEALDFKSADNSFVTSSDFDKSVNNLYWLVRSEFYSGNEQQTFDYIFGTDLVYDGQIQGAQRFNDFDNTCNPSNTYLNSHWTNLYKIVAETNTIISRLPASSMSEDKKQKFEAKAKFFRGFAYRTLAYLYGGVPIELEEIFVPKKNYVRSSKKEVLSQVIEDLKFAAENLSPITEVADGEISQPAAYHLLSEVYLANQQYEEAYDAATLVIDNPDLDLMKNRFGSLKSEPGDVYYDLFRAGNQNRNSGNTEAIWVIQYETNVIGGDNGTSNVYGSGYKAERVFCPLVRDLRVDGEGVSPFLWPNSTFSSGGRGVGFGIPTIYFSNTIWENSDWNDMRNSNYNIVRKFICDNPESKFYGQVLDTENPPEGIEVPFRSWFAYQSKCTTPGQHPEELFDNFETLALSSNAGFTYADQYLFRLAETYLLRAEAALGMNRKDLAKADINVVRSRANAKLCSENDIDIDYILDERMRELGLEEKRRLTLGRLGLVYYRTVEVAHNPLVRNMAEKHNLWPIPYEEIERNTEAVLEQNPGY